MLDVLLMSSLHDWQVSLLKKKLGAKIGSGIIAAVVIVNAKLHTKFGANIYGFFYRYTRMNFAFLKCAFCVWVTFAKQFSNYVGTEKTNIY